MAAPAEAIRLGNLQALPGKRRRLVAGRVHTMSATVSIHTRDGRSATFSLPADAAAEGNIAADRLRSLVERIERLEEEKKALAGDIKDIYAEAKSAGFDVKVLRQLIRIRRQEPAEVEEQETLLDVYRRALGM